MQTLAQSLNLNDARFQIALALAATFPVVAAMVLTGNPIFILGLAVLPLLVIGVVQYVFVTALLFVAFSYFKIHEAYPFLLNFKIPLALGALSLGGVIFRISVTDEGVQRVRDFRLPLWTVLVGGTVVMSLMFFVSTFEDLNSRPGQLLTIMVMASFIAVMFLSVHIMNDSQSVPWPREAWLMVCFFALVTAGILTSRDVSTSMFIWQVTYWKVAAISISIIWLIRRPEDFRLFIGVILVSGVLISAVAIRNDIFGIDLVEGTRVTIGRFLYETKTAEELKAAGYNYIPNGSSLGDPNDLALVLMLPLSFGLACLVERHSRGLTILAIFAVPMLLAAVVATQSRGAVLGVLAIIAVIGSRFIKSRIVLGVLGATALVGLVAVMGIAGRSSGGLSELETAGLDASASSRLTTWMAAIRMGLAYPLTGVGIDNYTGQYYLFTDNWAGKAKAVHSTWFQVLAETGFTGFTLFIALMYATWRSIQNSLSAVIGDDVDPFMRTVALAVLAAFTGFCTTGTFLTQAFNWPVYLIIALVAAMSMYVTRQQNSVAARETGGAQP